MEVYREILKRYWGYDSFRGIQEEIIRSVGSGRDTLGLMPTGGGKSITYQVPALAKEGLCLVVSPLIALMKDQVQGLRLKGIKAAAVYSGMSHEEIVVALENCIFGGYKFLYVSPERLSTELFQTKLRSMRISMITVDEAHCISQWGYDFRPSYLKIAEIRSLVPDAPVLAVTATATEKVVDDIQRKLVFKQENVFRMSFERKNLSYIVRYTDDKTGKIIDMLLRTEGSAIVYTRRRDDTKVISEELSRNGITSTFFHAGLTDGEKDLRQREWTEGKVRVMVATNAFGMGIDKPDVRLVIHADVPSSVEEYFQEAGRAGRDGERAYAVLLWEGVDRFRLKGRIAVGFPNKKFIRLVYEDIQYYYQMAMGDGRGCTFAFDMREFCARFRWMDMGVASALRILTQAGHLEYIEEDNGASTVMFLMRRDELYHLNEGSADCENVIRCLLRMYTGLFSEYTAVREDDIARKCGLDRQRVYDTLVYLSKRRILHYIPGRREAQIYYTHERWEASRLSIPREVFEDRKKAQTERMEAMTGYAESRTRCRSVMLLRYFGEKGARPCGQCDYCRSQHVTGLRRCEVDEIMRKVTEAIEQRGELYCADLPLDTAHERESYDKVIRYMVAEEMVIADHGRLKLPEG